MVVEIGEKEEASVGSLREMLPAVIGKDFSNEGQCLNLVDRRSQWTEVKPEAVWN
jgi:hypothetical protein